jgi:hypothetical protein
MGVDRYECAERADYDENTQSTHNEPTEERDRLRDREHNSLVGDSLRYNKF